MELMELLIAGLMSGVIGLAAGQFVSFGVKGKKSDNQVVPTDPRIDAIERVIPTLITRNEVQDAINKVPPLVVAQVQSEMNNIGLALQSQQQQAVAPQPPTPPLPTSYQELNKQNMAKIQELQSRVSDQLDIPIPQIEELARQMKPRGRKPRQ